MLMSQFAEENLERNVRLFFQPLSQRLDDAREDLLLGLRQMVISPAAPVRACLPGARLLFAAFNPCKGVRRGHQRADRRSRSSPRNRRQSGEHLSIRLSRGGIRANVEEIHAGEKQ